MGGSKLYQAMGGTQTCRQLSVAFYARVKLDPVLRPLFPGKTLKCAIEEFSAFLAQLLGGPPEDAQRRWWLSLRESHLRFKIGPRERDAWMKNMIQALEEAPIEEALRAALEHFFERSSAYVINREDGDRSAPDDNMHREISQRWSAQLLLDETVAAVRRGAADQAMTLAESAALQTHFHGNRSVFAALLATMLSKGESRMLDYVRRKLLDDPLLAQERYSGRTLLHGAAAVGDTPLYCVANECKEPGGASVVLALVQAGAHVNACGRRPPYHDSCCIRSKINAL